MAKENIKIDLTNCEKMIMKVIWDEEGDCELQHLINELRDRYGKNYARTTVGTSLKKLINEGYVSTHRVGRSSFSHAEISEADYLEYPMNKENHFCSRAASRRCSMHWFVQRRFRTKKFPG